jgi:hypothetical protein
LKPSVKYPVKVFPLKKTGFKYPPGVKKNGPLPELKANDNKRARFTDR